MRRFLGYRPNPPAEYLEKGVANPPDQVQYEGIVFTDGTVVVRWLTDYRSHSVWTCWHDFDAVHGHPEYGTRIEWLDEEGHKADLVIVDEPMPHQEISGDCPDCGLPWSHHLLAAETLNQPALVDLIRKTASDPPPPGMTWSLAYEKLTGRRHSELDELVPKSGIDPLPAFLDDQGYGSIKPDTTEGTESP